MKYKDKLLHFSVCFVASILSPMLGLGLALGKEYGDSKSSLNHWCWYDMLFNILGITLGVYVKILLSHIM